MRLKAHLFYLNLLTERDFADMEAEALEQVRASGRQAEAVGVLGKSRPSARTLFEDVFKAPDARLVRQRREHGV